jgi:hypothetical protein
MAKRVNYRTAQGFTYRAGSVLQCSMVSPDNDLTRACYQAALEGKAIPHTLKGPGFQKAEIGMALAHAKLAELATELGVDVPETSSRPLGWPATWNLAALQATAPVAEDTAEESSPLALESPAPVLLLTDGDKALGQASGELAKVSTDTITAIPVPTGCDLDF